MINIPLSYWLHADSFCVVEPSFEIQEQQEEIVKPNSDYNDSKMIIKVNLFVFIKLNYEQWWSFSVGKIWICLGNAAFLSLSSKNITITDFS